MINNERLNRIKDTSKYYKLLLDFFSRPVETEYILKKDEVDLLNDKELFDQFILDLAGKAILKYSEDFDEGKKSIDSKKTLKEPDETIFNIIFEIEYARDEEISDRMYQIRNCFAHALTKKNGDVIEFYNKDKIKGTINISNLPLISILYSNVQKATDFVGNLINVEELEQSKKVTLSDINLYSSLMYINSSSVLARRNYK